MIIDSSALLAIVFQEPEEDVFVHAIRAADTRLMSAGNWLESNIAGFSRKGQDAVETLEWLKMRLQITVVPMTQTQADIARFAFMKFGKGNHAAKLNFGDCMAYALSKESGEPLLFKGDYFAKTDVTAVAY